jgi:hypothetical protein
MKSKFLFGDIVVINENNIGVVVKTWEKMGKSRVDKYEHEVYNSMTGRIEVYQESEIARYRVRHKYLNDEEMEYQWGS